MYVINAIVVDRLKMLYYDVFGIKAGGGVSKPQRPISLQRQRPVFFRMLPSSVKIFGKYGLSHTSMFCFDLSEEPKLPVNCQTLE